MNHRAEGIERLVKYGLTQYEARAYLGLLNIGGKATAREVCSLTRIPRTKIYSVLDELERKQLAVAISDKPRIYEGVPINLYLKNFEDRTRVALAKLEEDRKTMAGSKQGPAELARRRSNFNTVKGRRNVIQKKLDMLHRCETDVFERGTVGSGVRLANLLEQYSEAAARGVRVRYLGPVTTENSAQLRLFGTFAMLRNDLLGGAASETIIIDSKEILITHFVPDDGEMLKGDDAAIYSDDEGFVSDMARTLERAWEAGAAEDLVRKAPGRAQSSRGIHMGR
ncbi:MAG: TrmB family transcriptional regulator [Euryarchaeota archaeon]|nr:TrmB family transcriptional regulator [Euryarchaeota archaeon]